MNDPRPGPDAVFASIRHRRSVKLKDLDPAPIDRGLVERILEAANWAPSHGKTEPWRFVVFTGDSRSIVGDALGAAYRHVNRGETFSEEGWSATTKKVWLAPVWVALGVEPDPKRPEWEELIAFGCAVHNAQLMACSLGLGSKWTSGATAIHPLVATAVGFGPSVQLKGFLYLGQPAIPWPTGERRSIDDKVQWAGEPVREET